MNVFIIILQTVLLAFVVYFVWDSKKKDRVQETGTLATFTQTVSEVLSFIKEEHKEFYEAVQSIQTKYLEALEKGQIKYYDSLEKGLQKSNNLLDKNNKEFLKVFAQVFRKDIQVEAPKVLEADKVENSIENAAQPEEILLTDTPRIPIVEGVNMKFEDEEEVYPMNISPMEDSQEKVNPIEK